MQSNNATSMNSYSNKGVNKANKKTLKQITWNWNPKGHKLWKTTHLWVKLSKKSMGNQWKKEQHFLDSNDAIIGDKLSKCMMFHSLSNCKAT